MALVSLRAWGGEVRVRSSQRRSPRGENGGVAFSQFQLGPGAAVMIDAEGPNCARHMCKL